MVAARRMDERSAALARESEQIYVQVAKRQYSSEPLSAGVVEAVRAQRNALQDSASVARREHEGARVVMIDQRFAVREARLFVAAEEDAQHRPRCVRRRDERLSVSRRQSASAQSADGRGRRGTQRTQRPSGAERICECSSPPCRRDAMPGRLVIAVSRRRMSEGVQSGGQGCWQCEEPGICGEPGV